ncbi:hypothetical protein L6452_32583 [Arctium lappa]|uniref:Uncharacterized protein n=1 Tax=Arctium lappa TaxID=4217 RepID=A0ACB8Z5M9_ARCLA|nr:hypothetical protein L6452_32583 [Arctium lappa]
MSSANSPPELPVKPVSQAMLRSLVNHNQRLLEQNHALNARLEVYAMKLAQKKVKLENESFGSRRGGLVGASFKIIASLPFFNGCSSGGFGGLIPRLKLGIGISGPHCDMGIGCS